MRLACDYQAHASICERFSMKTGQHGMKFSMKGKRGRREAAGACNCYATAMRLTPILHHIVARASVARIQYKLPFTPHSFRGGAATQALRKGIDSGKLMLADRWKSFKSFQAYIDPSPV
ncbi:hypothetical protein Y032_0009g560 [Ancylostoma ceylanicum]|uniref:Uncharacterized protein n=1 Tax=Ancylostoma ceylanicum TaxID=53326 RepID=A0A016VIR8_9BILA|nr:hypothetical protein Y032_0009g560 [Ancylostoma ceylanicum]